MGKFIRWFLGLGGAAVVALGLYVASRQHLTFDPPYPDVTASTDSAVIARGRYVVRTLANCGQCHGDTAQMAAGRDGAEIPLSGGNRWDIPPGSFYARNLTSDSITGLGAVSDKAIARALRYGVGHDGRALLPFMEMQGLSDEDLVAVVSYLRTLAPVRNGVPAHRYSLLGKVVRATVLANPVGPQEPPPKMTPHGATLDNGKYLAEHVVNCWACHTQRSMATGQLTGPRFGGSTEFTEPWDPEHAWAPPNITSDVQTGKLAPYSEDAWVTRFRQGRVLATTPMPWEVLKKMNEDDLRAIYRYLKTIPPVSRDVGPVVRNVKK